MTAPETLGELAERCKKAAASQQAELIHEAFDLIFPKPKRIWVTDNTGSWTPEYAAYHELSWRFVELLEAGGFLDAAKSLMPKGMLVEVYQQGGDGLNWMTKAIFADGSFVLGYGFTEEGSRCAAALRAQAKDSK